jgi:ubiquitin-protein ligase
MDNQENQPIDPLGSIEPLKTFEPTPMAPPSMATPSTPPAPLVDRDGNVNLNQLQQKNVRNMKFLQILSTKLIRDLSLISEQNFREHYPTRVTVSWKCKEIKFRRSR